MTPAEYRALGYSPFPCSGKRPARASTWPNDEPILDGDNVAIPVPEGAVVIDLDKKPAVDGARLFAGLIPDGWTHTGPKARTGGGGYHLWFRSGLSTRIGNGRGVLPVGIDVRGGGKGYVVAPPSINGGAYEWVRPLVAVADLPELPQWLLAHLLAEPPPPKKREPVTFRDLEPYAEQALDDECDRIAAAPDGLGNEALNRAAFRMGRLEGMGLTYDRVLYAIEEAVSGWTWKNPSDRRGVPKVILSGWTAGTNAPRDEPEDTREYVSDLPKGAPKEEPPAAGDWPEPGKLPDANPTMEDIDPELVPLPFLAWLQRESEEKCMPLSGLVAGAIVALATVVGRGAVIYPETYGSWAVTPNLWGAIVAPPGMMKSAVLSAAFAPLDPLIAGARERYQADRAEMDPRVAILEGKIAKEKKSASASAQEIRLLKDEIDDCLVSEKRYTANDVTLERLQMIQADNPRGLAHIRDELAGWLANLSKVGREGDRSYFLEAWDGSKSSRIDRVGRKDELVQANCLSLFGTIQPSRLAPLVTGVDDGSSDDGLLQRLQILIYVDRLPGFKAPGPDCDKSQRSRVNEIFKVLDEALDHDKPRELRFDPSGQKVFDDWRARLEDRLRDDLAGEPAMASHLAKYRSLMPTLAGLFQLLEHVDVMLDGATHESRADGTTRISARNATFAVRWLEYLEGHASRLYESGERSLVAPVLALASRITAGKVADGMTLYQIKRPQWRDLADEENIGIAVEGLVKLGWIRVEKVQKTGRASYKITLNPGIGNTVNTANS